MPKAQVSSPELQKIEPLPAFKGNEKTPTESELWQLIRETATKLKLKEAQQ